MSSKMPLDLSTDLKSGLECRKETLYLENDLTGLKLFARYWYPADESKALGLVFICHGFAEHCAYYDDFGVMLANQNFIAFAHDHLGHGLSEGKRATIDSMDEHIQEVFVHSAKMKEQYLNLPCFIFGHSMGGLIALKAVLKNRSFFRGLILEGPLIAPKSKPPYILTLLAKVANKLIPDYVYLNMNLEDVSRDQTNIKRMENDPLRWHGGIKISMAVAFNDALKGLEHQLHTVTLPFLILHAEEDNLCDIEGSKMLHKRAKSKDKNLISFPNAGHNLFLEDHEIRRKAMEESASWLQQRANQ